MEAGGLEYQNFSVETEESFNLSGGIDKNLENYHIFQSVFVSPLDESSELLKLVCLMERTKIGTESTYSRMQGRSHISVFFLKIACTQETMCAINMN